ncbi:MAG: alpha/beta hydrolase, partial [Cyanobacteria bacterium P01_H01_bin.15]
QIQKANTRSQNFLISWIFLGAKPSLSRVEDIQIPGRKVSIPARVYVPRDDANLPLTVFFHGGGWVTCNLDTHDIMCRRIAQEVETIVVSVAYRLAPWHKFPTPLHDCYDALTWLAQNADSLNLRHSAFGVAGDSAGGNLATSVALMLKEKASPRLDYQVLLYPAVDGTLSCESHERLKDAPLLNQSAIQFYRNAYARSQTDWTDPYFSPLLAKELTGLPPALIMTAGLDPLHDEAEAYAQRLEKSQVPVDYIDYPEMVHGFMHFPRFCSDSASAFTKIADFIRRQTGLDSGVLS